MSKFVTLHGFGGGSSGADLNFEIVGGTTQPENPKENTIWVNTDVEISGWSFSATEPSEPSDGMIWINISTSGSINFNILNDNEIKVHPISAKQYVSGAWITVTAMIYQSNRWIEWIIYLYYEGNEYTDITGGWVASDKPLNSGWASVKGVPTATRNTDNITIVFTKNGLFSTKNAIDLTDIKTIKIYGSFNLNKHDVLAAGLVVLPENSTYTGASYRVAYVDLPDDGTECSLDVSSIEGKYIIGFVATNAVTNTIIMKRMELLR